MKPYFVWNATSCPKDQIEEIQENIEGEVARCISINHQEISEQLRIEVSDGPMSLIGDVTTPDGKTFVRFTYSLLQGGNTNYHFFGGHEAKQ